MILLKASYLLLLLSPVAQGVNYPVGITNCHYKQWIEKAPERVAVSSSGAVEIMLSMGLADRIIHSSWVKTVWEPLNEEFQKFKHYPKYPSAQQMKDSNPDMMYATYSSAFEDPLDPKRLVDNDRMNYTEFLELEAPCKLLISSNSYGSNKTYCREEIHNKGIGTYLASSYCEIADHRPKEVSVDALYQEVWDIAFIFDAVENARKMIDGIENDFKKALTVSQASGGNTKTVEPFRVFWLDIFQSKSRPDEKRPFVGSCCGGPQIVLNKAGAVNVFADQGKEDHRIWDYVEWDAVVATDPDLIVLIELSTESAAEKLYRICSDPVLRDMRAVKERQFLILPFAASNIGVRLGVTAYNMAEAMAALARGEPLNSLDFSTNNASEAVSMSGLKVWTTLPTWNGTDLESYCPGSNKKIEIKDKGNAETAEQRTLTESKDGLQGWAIGLITVLAVSAVGVSLFLVRLVQKEKSGNPLFRPIVKEGAESA